MDLENIERKKFNESIAIAIIKNIKISPTKILC